MSQLSRPFLPRLALFLAFVLVFTGVTLPAQTPSKVRLTIAVTKDDLPTPGSTVTIRPLGTVEGWPEGKAGITLTTDAKGLASTQLAAGKYRAIAHDPGNSRLPADGSFTIQPGQTRSMKIYLNLLYWDCRKVTCML
jgi:hypothetical protein